MALNQSSWQDQINFASTYPNLGPAKNILPNADYGRVAALKLVNTVFPNQLEAYVNGDLANNATTLHWGEAGRYHYHLLGKNTQLSQNEFLRANLAQAPQYGSFQLPVVNAARERDGPIYFRQVLSEISEMSRVYGIPFQTVTGAVLNILYGRFATHDFTPPVALTDAEKRGWSSIKSNMGILESLWGIRRLKTPKTFYKNVNAQGLSIASRQTYRKSRRGGRRGYRRRRRYY